MKTFSVQRSYRVVEEFEVTAEGKNQARELVQDYCYLTVAQREDAAYTHITEAVELTDETREVLDEAICEVDV